MWTAVFDETALCINPHEEGMTCYTDGASTKAIAFDAENHLLGSNTSIVQSGGAMGALAQNASCPPSTDGATSINQHSYSPPPPPSVTPSIFYGPDGHVIKDNGEQIYWDGDQPLFTVTSGGALDDIKVDGFAVYSAQQSQIAILDRDFSGTQVSQHNSTGYDSWGPQDPYHRTCSAPPAVGGTSGYAGVTERISQPGTDGVYDGGNTFQGARAYDPVAQQWTAPDAYAGDVHDPMSQKPYMWNRNNPLQYSDPSGYDTGGCALSVSTCGVQIPNGQIEAAYNFFIGNDIKTVLDAHASTGARIFAGIGLATTFFPVGKGLKAVEFAAGRITESGILRAAEKFLGQGYKDMGKGRFLSEDGMRQVRFGNHETRDPNKLHAHFEAYDRRGKHVISNSRVEVIPDRKP